MSSANLIFFYRYAYIYRSKEEHEGAVSKVWQNPCKEYNKQAPQTRVSGEEGFKRQIHVKFFTQCQLSRNNWRHCSKFSCGNEVQ